MLSWVTSRSRPAWSYGTIFLSPEMLTQRSKCGTSQLASVSKHSRVFNTLIYVQCDQ